MKHPLSIPALTLLLVGFLYANPQSSHAGQSIPLQALIIQTHIHGIAVDSVDPGNPDSLYAVTNTRELLTSEDGGITWKAFKQASLL